LIKQALAVKRHSPSESRAKRAGESNGARLALLLAGAIGSVFTWLVAGQLVKEGTQARELVSDVTLTLSGEADDGTDAAVSGITCRMSGRVAGVEETHLEVVARAAMTQCIERLGMRTEGLGVTVEASLEGS
jgi:hypothetical protein